MAISLKHKFESTVPDQPKPGLVRPSDWNDEHDLTLSSGYLVGRTSPGDGPAESIPVSSFASAAQGEKADSALQSFDVAAAVHAASSKSTPVDADEFALIDSAASFGLKRLTWANLKAAFKAYFNPREVLTANRTYYVRSDGNDANTGLANSSGGAFKTTQKAMDVAAALDIGIYDVTIQYGDTGPFTGCVLKAPIGSGSVIIVGDTANPSNYTITKNGSAYIFDGRSAVGKFQIIGVHPHDSTANYHFASGVPGNILTLTNIDYGDVINYMAAATGGKILITGANNKFSCSTSFTAFFLGDYHGYLMAPGATTFTWTRNTTHSTGFAYARQLGIVQPFNMTFNLAGFTATGPRFNVTDNASIVTGGGGASFLPGTSTGSQTNGGLYS